MLKQFAFFALLLLTSYSYTQDSDSENEACQPVSKKTRKILNEVKSSPNIQGKVDLFNKAISKEGEKAEVFFSYGKYAFDQGMVYYDTEMTPKKGDKSLSTAKDQFLKMVELCPNYHGEALYDLGVICLYQGEKEKAMPWFQKFLDYKNDDNEKYPLDYTKMVSDVKEVMVDYFAEKEFNEQVVPFEPFKVLNVSSKEAEYFPMISPDNELMFFTRKLDRKNLGDIVSDIREEFTFAERTGLNVDFDKGKPFDPPFNDGSFISYGAATMSVDNKEIILCACKSINISGQDYLNCDLYEAAYTRSGKGGNDYQWSTLKSLGPNINTSDGWEGQPSLSADGNTLYYTAMRRTTQDNDIYYSKRQKDGFWGPAVPFKEVNTAFKDKSPFIHQDDETFYFVSTSTDERRGAGGLDIFYVRRLPEGGWSKPKNIGKPINTPEDELGIFVSAEGSLAYFSSRQGGNWNIFGFELYVEARPESVVILKGDLSNEDGSPVINGVVGVTYEDGERQTFKVREDGRYAAVVKAGKKQDVLVTSRKEGFALDAKIISHELMAQAQQQKQVSVEGRPLKLESLEKGKKYEIEDILYNTNSAFIEPRSKLILKEFAFFMKENPSIEVKIIGHTDDVGDDQENLILSQNRASNVRELLIKEGVDYKRMKYEGLGESSPKYPNVSEDARTQNRRTEFQIMKM
jgi:outer membrane protein OmpA-like peptidoglycan-associated protein/tetratricopeptide (TPR) repeat protein